MSHTLGQSWMGVLLLRALDPNMLTPGTVLIDHCYTVCALINHCYVHCMYTD
jgi:hypothetical protein